MNHNIRNPLLRSVYERAVRDSQMKNTDHSDWYHLDVNKLNCDLQSKFIRLNEDEGTICFLNNCSEKSDQIFTQAYHLLLSSVLSMFMTKTSINGLLRRGSMFIFSEKQFGILMDFNENSINGILLDLGAGDGLITQNMAPFFSHVSATETSVPMTWRLHEKGYTVLNIEEWTHHHETYDVISVLNLIDRCEKPLQLMQSIHKCLKKDGKIILGVVFPFKPYVEFGGIRNKPLENLELSGSTFEEQVNSFNENVIIPSGFVIEKLTKLPYLCEGDIDTSFYILFDAVFVLKHQLSYEDTTNELDVDIHLV